MTTSKAVSVAHELHQKLVGLVSVTKRNVVVMGKILSEIKHNDNFRLAVGEGIDTWDAYIAQPEIGLSRGDADRMIQIYEVFVEQYGYDPDYIGSIPVKNLHYLLPIAKHAGVDDSLLEDARVLSQKDFRERIHDIKDSSGTRTYEYLVMQRCIETGNMRRVQGISSDDIKINFSLE